VKVVEEQNVAMDKLMGEMEDVNSQMKENVVILNDRGVKLEELRHKTGKN
jgi:hypothetical protein